MEPVLVDKEGRVCAWCVGYSEEEIEELLARHPDWHRAEMPD